MLLGTSHGWVWRDVDVRARESMSCSLPGSVMDWTERRRQGQTMQEWPLSLLLKIDAISLCSLVVIWI